MRGKLAVSVFVSLLVVASASGANLSWKGSVGAGGGNWSNPANWTPSAVPAPGDTLVFGGSSIATFNVVNDLPAYTPFHEVTFDRDYVVSGNPIVINRTLTLNTDMGLGIGIRAGTDIHVNIGPRTGLDADLDVNGHMVTINSTSGAINGPINGMGSLRIWDGSRVTIRSNGSFDGPMSLGASVRVAFEGSLPGAQVTMTDGASHSIFATMLTGYGVVGALSGAGLIRPEYADGIGTLVTGSINFGPSRRPTEFLLSNAGPSQIQVVGPVALGAGVRPLALTPLSGFTPAPGQAFRLIDNDGADPITGHFQDYPEGAVVTMGSHGFRVTYVGGDGNDMELIEGTTCSYAVSPAVLSVPILGGVYRPDIIATAGCAWRAISNVSWIDVAPVPQWEAGVGNGWTQIHVGSNPGPNRIGTVSIGDATLVVEQVGCVSEAPGASSPQRNAVVDSPVTFSWLPASGAINYAVFVLEAGKTTHQLLAQTAATSVTVPLAPGSYTWWVHADFNLCPTLESEHIRFTVSARGRRRAAR